MWGEVGVRVHMLGGKGVHAHVIFVLRKCVLYAPAVSFVLPALENTGSLGSPPHQVIYPSGSTLSIFFSVSFHTSFLISSSQHLFLLIAAFNSLFYHTLYGFFPPFSLSHTLLLHFAIYLLQHMLNTIFSIPFYSLPIKRPRLSFSVLMFPQFLTSNPPNYIHCLFSLNPYLHQSDFTQYNKVI